MNQIAYTDEQLANMVTVFNRQLAHHLQNARRLANMVAVSNDFVNLSQQARQNLLLPLDDEITAAMEVQDCIVAACNVAGEMSVMITPTGD